MKIASAQTSNRTKKRTCAGECGRTKSASRFEGSRRICIQCRLRRHRAMEAGRDVSGGAGVDAKRNAEIRERNRSYYLKNRDALLDRNFADRLRARYGISVEDYERMVEQQGGVCAICSSPPKPGRRLDVDHCHDTGIVRGLLCRSCNTSMGGFGDSADRMRSAISYLEKIR